MRSFTIKLSTTLSTNTVVKQVLYILHHPLLALNFHVFSKNLVRHWVQSCDLQVFAFWVVSKIGFNGMKKWTKLGWLGGQQA